MKLRRPVNTPDQRYVYLYREYYYVHTHTHTLIHGKLEITGLWSANPTSPKPKHPKAKRATTGGRDPVDRPTGKFEECEPTG